MNKCDHCSCALPCLDYFDNISCSICESCLYETLRNVEHGLYFNNMAEVATKNRFDLECCGGMILGGLNS